MSHPSTLDPSNHCNNKGKIQVELVGFFHVDCYDFPRSVYTVCVFPDDQLKYFIKHTLKMLLNLKPFF